VSAVVRTDLVLSSSTETHVINVPIDKIDIGRWLFTLPDAEYQRCAPGDHKAAGTTVSEDGRPMSINVEMIGSGLVVQHYVGEVVEPDHCRMVSTSDVLTPHGWTTVQVIWELRAEPAGEGRTRYTNTVTSHPTQDFLAFNEANGGTFEEAARARQAASGAHNARETPLFAESIAHAALARPVL
jgi:hypothetical protein